MSNNYFNQLGSTGQKRLIISGTAKWENNFDLTGWYNTLSSASNWVKQQLQNQGWQVSNCVFNFSSGANFLIQVDAKVSAIYSKDQHLNVFRNICNQYSLSVLNVTLYPIKQLSVSGSEYALSGASIADVRINDDTRSNSQVNSTFYVVRSGDTLNGIAQRYGMTLANLLALNPQITNPNLISVGQQIRVSGTPNSNNFVVSSNPIMPNNSSPVTPAQSNNWLSNLTGSSTYLLLGIVGVALILRRK